MRTNSCGWALRSLLAGFLVLSVHAPAWAQDKSVPKDLLQYVREAKRGGLGDLYVEQIALKAGWSADAIKAAIADVYKGTIPGLTPGTGAGASAEPQAEPAPGAAPAAENASAPETWQGHKHAVVDSGVPYDYQIGAGDVLQISVWKEPEASASVVVRPDGKITLPLLKEVQVAGMTPTDVEKLITEGLSKTITEPDVTVIVGGINSKKIYAIGAIKREGPIAYTYKMSIMQAISEAGGLTDYAKRKKIYILRTENGVERRLVFDYDAALKGERTDLNVALLPGDTLVVPH